MPRAPAKKISLFGNFGSLNIGNECTLQTIIFNIRALVPSAEIDCICTKPADVSARHQVHAFAMSSRDQTDQPASATASFTQRVLRLLFVRLPGEIGEWARAIRLLKGSDTLVMTGTGMLTDHEEGLFGLPYEIFKWAVSAKWCRVRLQFVSVGVEPIRLRPARFFIWASLRLADYVCFRDRHSSDSIRKIGFDGERTIYPDLAFSLSEDLLGRYERSATEHAVVGVGVFDYAGRGSSGSEAAQRYSAYLMKLSDFIIYLVGRGYAVRILIGDMRYDNAVRDDLRKTLASRGIEYDTCRVKDEPVSSVANTLEQIASTDFVVASRYHNIVLALLLRKPVISISYEDKNDALMSDLGLTEYCQRLDAFDVETLVHQFAKLEENRGELKKRIGGKMREYREALTTQYSIILADVTGPKA